MTDHTPDSSGATNGAAPDLAPPEPVDTDIEPWVCTATSPLAATLADGHAGRPMSLWPTGQRSDAAQRAGRYQPDMPKHPGRLLADLAIRIITACSQPGQKILGLFCGSGTSVVEAVYAGRDAIGLDNDRRRAAVTRTDLAYAGEHGAAGTGHVTRADARFLPAVPRRLRRSVDLVIATPPTRLTPIRPGTYPHSNEDLVNRLDSDLSTTLHGCAPLLHPGSTVVIVTRLIHRSGRLVDLTYRSSSPPRRPASTWSTTLPRSAYRSVTDNCNDRVQAIGVQIGDAADPVRRSSTTTCSFATYRPDGNGWLHR